ncbi:NUDIX domain-containing protein [Candidatus Saccharibacteria bacterium]|nr:NUDIX domain-containing protein [Candidatus Saccharibacteria bacterium]
MPHINTEPNGIDYTAVCYIVNDRRVLLAHHIALGFWVPIGGHIEPSEDPETALWREINEECGLQVEIQAERPGFHQAGTVGLPRPRFVDIHAIASEYAPGHRHMAFVYFGRTAERNEVLAEREHFELRWFDPRELKYSEAFGFRIPHNVCWYGRRAIQEVAQWE